MTHLSIAPRCTRCHLHSGATNVKIPSKGSDQPLVLFIGDQPGATDDAKNEMFTGNAGQKLFELLDTVGIDQSVCRFTSIVRCIPWNDNESGPRQASQTEIDACLPHTEAEILTKDPVFIVTLGNGSLKSLIPSAPNIGKARKSRLYLELPRLSYIYNKAVRWAASQGHDPNDSGSELVVPQAPTEKIIRRYIAKAEALGFPHIEQRTFTVYPTYHPYATLRDDGQNIQNSIIEDLSYIKSQITGEKSIPFENYKLLESLDEIKENFEYLKDLHKKGELECITLDVETAGDTSNAEKVKVTGLSPYRSKKSKLLLYSISYGKGKAFTVPFQHCLSPFAEDKLGRLAIGGLTQDLLDHVPVVNFNIKFDLHWLADRLGINLNTINVVGDPFLAAWTLWNDTVMEKNLEVLVTSHVGMINHKEEMHNALAECYGTVFDDKGDPREPTMDDIDIDIVHRYCCADTDGTLRLHHWIESELKDHKLLDSHRHITVRAIVPTTMMERDAVRCDIEMLHKAKGEFEEKIDQVYAKLDEWGYGTTLVDSINSIKIDKAIKKGKKPPKQLIDSFCRKKAKNTLQLTSAAKNVLLFDILGLTPLKWGKEGPSSDKETLGNLLEQCVIHIGKPEDSGNEWTHKHEVVSVLRQFSADTKMYTSYIKPMPSHVGPDGLLHTNFGIRTTKTGRYVAKDPSLHVMPWKSIAKRALVPLDPSGLIFSADHSQAELRVLASVTKDEAMISAFNSGADIHRMIAAIVMGKPPEEVLDAERRRIKTIVFGICYGRHATTIAAQERISLVEAEKLIKKFFKLFPGVAAWVNSQHAYGKKYNCVWSPFGFRRIFQSFLDDNEKDRRSVNTPIQSGASDLSVLGIINIHKMLKSRKLMKSTLFGFVHDSTLFSVYPGELWDVGTIAKKGMHDLPQDELKWLKAPLKIDFEVGPSWGELTEAKLLPDRQVKFESCKPAYHDKLTEVFMSWPNPPELISQETIYELEDGSAIYQSLSAVKSRDAKTEEKVNAIWKFPPLQKAA